MRKNRFITTLFCLMIVALCGLMFSACDNGSGGSDGGGGGGSSLPKEYPLTATDGTLNYNLLSDKSGYTVTGLVDEEYAGDVVIPATINELGITKIDASTFLQCNISSIVIGANVKTIGGKAFYNAAQLTSVSFPASLTTFESVEDDEGIKEFRTFRMCTSLTDITFAPGCKLTEIPDYAFQGTKLSHVVIPSAVERIGDSAFESVNRDGTFTVEFEAESELKTIGESAFANSGLRSFVMPNTVTETGEYVFSSCHSLSSVSLSSALKILKNETFSYATSLQTVEIAASIETIERSAFANSGLTSVTFAQNSNCTEILHNAFINTKIEEIKFPAKLKSIGANTPQDANSGAFPFIETLAKITFTSPLVQVGEASFLGCSALTDIVFEGAGSIESIGARAFNGCLKLKGDIAFPSGLKSVGELAFNRVFSTVTLPATVETLGDNAFSGESTWPGEQGESITFLHDNIDRLQIGSLNLIDKIIIKSELIQPFKDKFTKFSGLLFVALPQE